MESFRLPSPSISQRRDLIAVEHEIGGEHGGRPRLVGEKLQLLLS